VASPSWLLSTTIQALTLYVLSLLYWLLHGRRVYLEVSPGDESESGPSLYSLLATAKKHAIGLFRLPVADTLAVIRAQQIHGAEVRLRWSVCGLHDDNRHD
jgi:hypothetical protein